MERLKKIKLVEIGNPDGNLRIQLAAKAVTHGSTAYMLIGGFNSLSQGNLEAAAINSALSLGVMAWDLMLTKYVKSLRANYYGN